MPTGEHRPTLDFAISYAGPDRPVAERLASLLTEGGAAVFIDTRHRSHLIGKRLDVEFGRVFGSRTRYFVPVISSSYADRPWPQHEWDIAVREAKSRSEEFILPVRVDDALLVGFPGTVACLDLRQQSVEEVAELLLEKLKGVRGARPHDWIGTFGLLIDDLLKSGKLPSGVPTDYPHLCDWLTDDLLARLMAGTVVNPRITEDTRDGEILSVRVAFEWNPEDRPLDFGVSDWWEVLEVLPCFTWRTVLTHVLAGLGGFALGRMTAPDQAEGEDAVEPQTHASLVPEAGDPLSERRMDGALLLFSVLYEATKEAGYGPDAADTDYLRSFDIDGSIQGAIGRLSNVFPGSRADIIAAARAFRPLAEAFRERLVRVVVSPVPTVPAWVPTEVLELNRRELIPRVIASVKPRIPDFRALAAEFVASLQGVLQKWIAEGRPEPYTRTLLDVVGALRS